MSNNEIDLIEYGALTSQVKTLSQSVAEMERDVKSLLELANKSKGGFWVGMTIASIVGGFISWIIHTFAVR